ncbi:hypothetical protein [Mariniluteicoccus flavus]
MTTPESRATGAMLAALGLFQAALAAGAPWGRAAYGGSHPGVLPANLRATSAVTAVAYIATAALLATDAGPLARITPRTQGRVLTGVMVLMAVSTIPNAISRSPVERAIWTPFAAVTAVLAHRARARHRRLHPAE